MLDTGNTLGQSRRDLLEFYDVMPLHNDLVDVDKSDFVEIQVKGHAGTVY